MKRKQWRKCKRVSLHEYSLDEKVAHVMRQLQRNEARILFDPVTSTVDIVIVSAGNRKDLP